MAPKAKAKGAARSRSSSASAPKGRSKAKAKANSSASPSGQRSKTPSPEDIAAIRLQAAARGFLARRLRVRLREDKIRYEAEMAEAVRAAEVAVINMERRRAEAERAKAEEKRKKAKQLAEDSRAALEAAYDGDVGTLQKLLDGGLPVDVADGNGLTSLSEAASGGAEDALKLLLERKANPNTRGEFMRTPLWRAAYAGHGALVRMLLEAGGDPRLHDQEGCCPVDCGTKDDVVEILRGWDVARTDELVEEYESWAEDERLAQSFKIQQAMREVDSEFDAAKRVHEGAQKILAHAKAEFRERQKIHGQGLAAGNQDAIDSCKSADDHVQKAYADAEAAQARFDRANVARLRAAEDQGIDAALPGREVRVQDLNNVVMRDIGDRIATSKQWPLIIDPSDCAKKMIVYSGSILLNFWKGEEMQPERIRSALLTMIARGGILAIDLFSFSAGIDRDLLARPFDEVREGLLGQLLSREILETPKGSHWPKYRDLVRPDERRGKFALEHFDDKRAAQFKFVLVTATEMPSADLLALFEALRVVPA